MVYVGGSQLSQVMVQLQLQQAQFNVLVRNPVGALENLAQAFEALSPASQAQALAAQAPTATEATPSPATMQSVTAPLCGSGYARFDVLDLASGAADSLLARLFNPRRRAAAEFEKLLTDNTMVRSAFENTVGGRVLMDGSHDGRFVIQRFPDGAAPLPSLSTNPVANTVAGLMSDIEASILGQLQNVAAAQSTGQGQVQGLTANPFSGLMATGFTNVLGGLGLGGGVNGEEAPFGFGMLSGAGVGSYNPLAMPGRIQNTTPAYEKSHQAQVDSVLNDPSLTIEDKVTLMLMLVMKKQDNDIERQAQYINSIQQQQSNRGAKGTTTAGMLGGVAGTALGGPAGSKAGGAISGMVGGTGDPATNNAPSIDVETLKLQRMVTKRTQMFDMLKAIIDKYNETAKGVIQSLGR
ncbi:MAG: hypothetical protein HY791_07905 [Deltaproteobacteria bacterium]|nr:hypothetical protein [Deltaproteobacteria bacterium]